MSEARRARETGSLAVEEFFRGFRGCVDLTIDQKATGVRAAGAVELPSNCVTFASELGPFRGFVCVLLEPEMIALVSKRAQAGVAQPLGPGFDIRKLDQL